MFDLESAISTWKRSLRHRRVLLGEDLDELEQHVRDQVQTLIIRGHDEEAAYRIAMQKMGAHPAVEEAYRRVYWGKLRRKGLLTITFKHEAAMFKNYVVLALRNLKRYPGYTFINVAGLAVGVACCLLILLFVRDEVSFDRFHANADRIVRVTLQIPERELEVTPTIVAPLFKRTFAEVEEATRVYDIGRFRKVTIRRGADAWQESGFMYADSTIFDVFTFPFVAGSAQGALNRPRTLVLTESMAGKYFSSAQEALGQSLIVGTSDFEVTGVIQDIPTTSHLRFDILGSFVSTNWANSEIWGSANFYTYLLLTRPDAVGTLSTSVAELVDEYRADSGLPPELGLGLQRLTDIYLVHMGRERTAWMFSALAVLILFIACINYINLSTARAARRAREVGMRKALGAHRGQIVRQFFGESAILAVAAIVVGLGLAALYLPAFNELSVKALSLDMLDDAQIWVMLLALLLVTTVGAGLYPALHLSGFHPAVVLKGSQGSRGNGTFRKVLVVFQFAVTIFLFVATSVVFNQLRFIQNSDVGFDREQVVVLPLADRNVFNALPALQQRLQQNPRVLETSAMNGIPGRQVGGYGLYKEGQDPAQTNDVPRIMATPVDHQVVETLGLELLAGPGFSEPSDYLAYPDSGRYQYLINEELVKLAGWTVETAVGQRMAASSGNRMGDVVGVIRNYNFLPLHEEMLPQALFMEPSWNVFLIKIATQDVGSTIEMIRSDWNELTGGSPFEYTFLDDEYNAFYEAEQRLGMIFGGAALLAVLVACLGLFGLASFTAEQRTREIGIRKVMGASVRGLVTMLNREFTVLVLVAFVLSAPVAWWAMDKWLSGFAFRTEVTWVVFALAGLVSLLIAWVTVSYQSIRAASTDPVKALRYD